jgi:hypothetical protein
VIVNIHKIRYSHFFLLFLLVIACCTRLSSQPYCNPDNGTKDPLKYPWAGGLNSCQFGEIDLNLDGIDDLVVFDRHGDRILPFLNKGVAGVVDYTYDPGLGQLLPELHEWVIFADYNCDGKQDIFTYLNGGIRVFENISDSVLKFKLVTNQLESYYYTGKVGIFVSLVDYPAIADIDLDGDPDILTFFGLGSFVEYHRNLSVEKNGTCDSLDYRLSDKCWGDFKESEGSNLITLNITCPYKYVTVPMSTCSTGPDQKHTGSTMLALDLDGNSVKDLLLGDVDFPNLKALINGGTFDSAHITSQDTLFPGNSKGIRLFSFPAASNIDVDNDGVRDLIVSPFDPGLTISDNFRSAWYYKNTGTNALPNFNFITDQFLQGEMIDAGSNSCPVLYDLNNDGLKDLIIGDYGFYDSSYYKNAILYSKYSARIRYYKNRGTSENPVFEFVTDDLGNISTLQLTGAYPAFGDLDGDGDADMLLGSSDSTLMYFENLAGPNLSPSFAPPIKNYQQIKSSGYLTPQLFDLSGDGLNDLVFGNRDGVIHYYKNSGTLINPHFELVTNKLGNVNVTNPALSYTGYSTPCFFHTGENKIALLVGSEEGKIHYYTDIEENLTGTFPESNSLYKIITGTPFEITSGWRTAPAIDKISDPVFFDLLVGNYAGGVNYFTRKNSPVVIPAVKNKSIPIHSRIKVFPNPADKMVTVDIGGMDEGSGCQISLIDLQGTTLFRLDLTSTNVTSFSAENLIPGVYIIKVFSIRNSQCNIDYSKILIYH